MQFRENKKRSAITLAHIAIARKYWISCGTSRTLKEQRILATHRPPYGHSGLLPGMLHNSGCPALRDAVERIKPQLHGLGHVHGAHGMKRVDGTLFVNATLLGLDGGISGTPIAMRIP